MHTESKGQSLLLVIGPADYELPGVEEVSANSVVSVVIPAYRERSTILATLQRLASEAERPVTTKKQ
jgi:hypothetical protein